MHLHITYAYVNAYSVYCQLYFDMILHMSRYRHPQYQLRMAPELREKIQIEADKSNRSLHAEIIARLEQSFESSHTESEVAELTYQVKLMLSFLETKEELTKDPELRERMKKMIKNKPE